MSSPSQRLRSIDLDTALKSTMIKLCRDLGLPHSGRKAQLAHQLRIRRSTLPPAVTTPDIATTTAQAPTISQQSTLSPTLTHTIAAPTSNANNATQQPGDTGLTLSSPLQPVIQTGTSSALQPNVSPLALHVPSIGATLPLAPAPQTQLGGASLSGATLPITLPLMATQANTSGAMLPISLPLMASQANTSGATLPVSLPLMASQANTSGAMLPVSLPLMASQANTSGATLPVSLPLMASQANTTGATLPVSLPLMTSQANTSGATLPATIPPLASQVQPVNLQLIAQQAAQLAAEQAVARVLALPSHPQGLLPLPAALHNLSQSASLTSPHSSTVPTTVAGAYQPPAATTETISSLQAALATRAAAPTQPGPSSIHLAPLSGTIPTIPAKFITAAAAGEFVDFNELLHAIEVDSGEEPALCIQVGEGQQLALPRKPKKKVISSFSEWVRCFSVYASTLCAYQPLRGPDMLAYLHVIASAHEEFQFAACMAYDVAFRKKAANFRLSSWGHIDPQIYSKAFTGASKAKPSAHSSLCLSTFHSTSDCPLYSSGPAKKARTGLAGPKRLVPLHNGKEICLNFNRGRCSRENCTRAHVCSLRGCGGAHPASQCTLRRFSPRKR